MSTDETVTVTAAEFRRDIGMYLHIALAKPVAITKDGREHLVLLSADELHRLKRGDRRVLTPGELSEQQIEAIRNSKVPDEYAYLDEELRDWKG